MSDTAIRIDGLSKQYRIGAQQAGYRTLRETVMDTCRRPMRAMASWRRRTAATKPDDDERTVWALRNLSFEVKQGEVVGIIGRNGAGKSTLLKILSRITEPSTGEIDLYGRVGTLLEVGTGFHSELTGRENIFLNGAILGMRRADIQRQFDDIVSFAEVERFVNTPVKHYSSGMYLRLAFAVAAHLDPEILLVNEVLAVGDISFQKKCLGKMDDVAKQGRTILFVSHNMGAVRSLCEKGVVLNDGEVVMAGNIGTAIETYYRLTSSVDGVSGKREFRPGTHAFGPITLVGREGSSIQQSEAFEVSAELQIGSALAGFSLLCIVDDMHQRRVFQIRTESTDIRAGQDWEGKHVVNLKLPALWLEPGLYTLYFKLLPWTQGGVVRVLSDPLHLDVGGVSCGWGSILSPQADWSLSSPGAHTAQGVRS